MPTQAEQIADLYLKFNELINAAKKINQLPAQDILNTSSLIPVMIDGETQSLEIQKIIDAFVTNTYKELLTDFIIEPIEDDTLIIPPIDWRIFEEYFNTVVDTEITIVLASTGMKRTDIVVATNSGTIEVIPGPESATTPIAQPTPYNAVFITQYTVTDSEIEDPTPPINGSLYVTKTEKNPRYLVETGSINAIFKGHATLRFSGTIDEIVGWDFSAINFPIYQGMDWAMINDMAATDLPIQNDDPAGILKIFTASGATKVLKPGEGTSGKFFIESGNWVAREIDSAPTNGDDYVVRFTSPVSQNYATLNEWRAGNVALTLGVGTTAYGTGATPSSLDTNSGYYHVPSGYVIEEIMFNLFQKSTFGSTTVFEIFVQRGEPTMYSSTLNSLNNVEIIAQQTITIGVTHSTPKYFHKLTIASHVAKDLSVFQVATREKGTINLGLGFGLYFKFKKV